LGHYGSSLDYASELTKELRASARLIRKRFSEPQPSY